MKEVIYKATEYLAQFMLGAMILGGGIIMNILIWGGLYHLIKIGASQ